MTLSVESIELRSADAAECRAGGMEPHEALDHSISNSSQSYIVRMDGEVLGVWGWEGSALGAGCSAWLLTTPACEGHKVFVARHSLKVMEHLFSIYPYVNVWVHEEHTVALAWLKWLGFYPVQLLPPFAHLQAKKDTKWGS